MTRQPVQHLRLFTTYAHNYKQSSQVVTLYCTLFCLHTPYQSPMSQVTVTNPYDEGDGKQNRQCAVSGIGACAVYKKAVGSDCTLRGDWVHSRCV